MFSKNFEKEIGTKKIYCEYTSTSELMKYYFCFVQLEMMLYKSTKVGEKMSERIVELKLTETETLVVISDKSFSASANA